MHRSVCIVFPAVIQQWCYLWIENVQGAEVLLKNNNNNKKHKNKFVYL